MLKCQRLMAFQHLWTRRISCSAELSTIFYNPMHISIHKRLVARQCLNNFTVAAKKRRVVKRLDDAHLWVQEVVYSNCRKPPNGKFSMTKIRCASTLTDPTTTSLRETVSFSSCMYRKVKSGYWTVSTGSRLDLSVTATATGPIGAARFRLWKCMSAIVGLHCFWVVKPVSLSFISGSEIFCSEFYNGTSGWFGLHEGNQPSPPNMWCTWVIMAGEGHVVQLNFLFVDLSPNDVYACNYEYLQVRLLANQEPLHPITSNSIDWAQAC